MKINSKLLIYIFSIYSTLSLANENDYYFLIGISHIKSNNTYFQDYEDNNSELPLLFGSADIGVKGDFGNSAGFELAIGKNINEKFSLELAYTQFPSLDFEGNANFTNSGDFQPTSSKVKSHLFMLNTFYHFKLRNITEKIKFQPYLGIGLGQARNNTDPVFFEFPEFDQGVNGQLAASITPKGSRSGFANQLIGGIKFPITKDISLDLKYKYIDHGRVQTNSGDLRILRFNEDGSVAIDTNVEIQKTAANLKSNNLMLGITLSF